MSGKTAVLLLNLGGPDSIAAIKPFLLNLFSDREIIRLPLQPVLARLIARGRSKKVASRYQAIGGKSPILDITREQAAALKNALAERFNDMELEVFIGMRYWHPLIDEAVEQITAGGFQRLVVLSLFPQYSRATTGSCLNEVKSLLASQAAAPATTYIESWYDNPDYLAALAETIQAALAEFDTEKGAEPVILFSAHALPQEFVDRGDPYPRQLQATIEGVMSRLPAGLKHKLSFQSRSGPVKWMEPQTDKVITDLAAEGVKRILIVPISFVSDHIETLFEIDIMYRELAEGRGIVEFRRSPSLNTRPLFIKALAGLVANHLLSSI